MEIDEKGDDEEASEIQQAMEESQKTTLEKR